MKNFNRILALVLALMMLISVVVVLPASAAEVTYNKDALDRLVKLNIYQGKKDGDKIDLAPEDDVTREQMAMFVARVMTGKVTKDAWANFVNDTPFKDINDRPELNIAAIAYAYDKGIIIGKSADIFDPKGNVTYQEALTMVVRALVGYEKTKDLKYPNGFINAAIEMGLTDGISGVEYKEKAIRGVTATILYNALTVKFKEFTWKDGDWWPTVNVTDFSDKFELTSGKYMLTSVTEVRGEDEFTQKFPGTDVCKDGDYVVFTPLSDKVTLDTSADRFVLATELAKDLGADLAKKIGYVYDLTFEGEKLAWVDDYDCKTFKDYGKVEDQISVTDDGKYLVVANQKYEAKDEVKAESLNPTKIYDLRLFQYNKDAMKANNSDAFVDMKNNIAGIKDNEFQEVTLFDTNEDGMFDYGIYVPYYIGNRLTAKDADGVEHFTMPAASDYDFQKASVDKTSAYNKTADWNFSGKATTWSRLYVYKVNPVSMDIDVIEELDRKNVGELTKIVNYALTGALNTVIVGGKEFANINKLKADKQLKGVEGAIKFEYDDRMPEALKKDFPVANWEGIFQAIAGDSKYGTMQIHELAGYTLIGWPSIVRNYNFVAFDWMDAEFSIENDGVLVVDHALTDASGNYTTVKIDTINNGYDALKHTFNGMEFEAYCDTIEVIYPDFDLVQYNTYFDETKRAAIMDTNEYAKQLRLNIMEEINGKTAINDSTPELFAIVGQDANGNLILDDVTFDNEALLSPAVEIRSNKKTTVAGTMTFYNGIAAGTKDDKFCSSSRDSAVVSTTAKLVMTDSTVFTIVAKDGIFTYTGKPVDGDSLVLTADTLLIAANTSKVMLVDRDHSINEIAKGGVQYLGKFLNEENEWENRTIPNTWAFNENTNNCPQGFKWLVDNAYLVTSETKLETIAIGDDVIYTYTDLYNLITCKYEAKSFEKELALTLGTVVIDDCVDWDNDGEFVEEGMTLADAFHVYGANNVNWKEGTFQSKLVSGSTVGYYQIDGVKYSVAPNLVIVVYGKDSKGKDVVSVSTDLIKDLKDNTSIYYTVVNGVPTGYAFVR